MTETNGGTRKLLVVAKNQSFGHAVVDSVDATEAPVSANYIESIDASIETTNGDIAGAVVDSQVTNVVSVIERLTDDQNLPVVVLANPIEGSDTISCVIEAGARDIFPRTSAPAQYELIVERLLDEHQYQRHTISFGRAASHERAFEQIFHGVIDPIAVYEPNTLDILDANDAFLDLVDVDDLESIRVEGLENFMLVEEGYTVERARDIHQRVAETGDPETFEWKGQDQDGDVIWLEVKVTAADIRGESVTIASHRDVTERVEREREIRESERRFRVLAEHIDQVIYLASADFSDILYITPTYEEIFGRPVDELSEGPRSFIEAAHPDDRDHYESDIEQLIEDIENDDLQDVYEGQYRIERDGETRWVAVARFPIENDQGVVDRVVGRVQDITERRRREQEYKQIFNEVSDTIAVFHPETGEILNVNETYHELWGYDDLKTIQELGIEGLSVTEEGYTGERGRELIREVATTGETKIVEWRGETKAGEHRWTEAKLTAAEIGGEQRVLSIQRDITERKRREQRLEVFNRILRHNLRNHIDVIRSHAEVLAEQTTDNHAKQIIAEVDDIAKIGARVRETDHMMSMDDTPTKTDLSESVREKIAAIESNRSDVAVTTELPGSAPIWTNERGVAVAVESALENAFEYAESSIKVSIAEHSDGYIMEIKDDGPGIPDEELVPIEARTETDLQHGTGLGLWQLRWSVDKLNGELSFDTTEGTTVRIAIPDRRGTSHSD